jgi:hypothetical protein
VLALPTIGKPTTFRKPLIPFDLTFSRFILSGLVLIETLEYLKHLSVVVQGTCMDSHMDTLFAC